ncbi:MAG: hypothetical protein AAF670_00990 [Planctomycetota bacterium]
MIETLERSGGVPIEKQMLFRDEVASVHHQDGGSTFGDGQRGCPPTGGPPPVDTEVTPFLGLSSTCSPILTVTRIVH